MAASSPSALTCRAGSRTALRRLSTQTKACAWRSIDVDPCRQVTPDAPAIFPRPSARGARVVRDLSGDGADDAFHRLIKTEPMVLPSVIDVTTTLWSQNAPRRA